MAAAATVMQRMTARRLLIDKTDTRSCLCNKLSRKRCYATPHRDTTLRSRERDTPPPHKTHPGKKSPMALPSPP